MPAGTQRIKEEKEKEAGNVSIVLHTHDLLLCPWHARRELAYDDRLSSLSAAETHECVWALNWMISPDNSDPRSFPWKRQSSLSHTFVLLFCLHCCFTPYLEGSNNYVKLTISQIPSSVDQHSLKQIIKVLALIFSSTDNNKKTNQITIECEKHLLLTSWCTHFLTNKISITQPMPQRYLMGLCMDA